METFFVTKRFQSFFHEKIEATKKCWENLKKFEFLGNQSWAVFNTLLLILLVSFLKGRGAEATEFAQRISY